jgi:hypothetical protein
MSLEEKETISLSFPEEEEIYSIFLKEDLIKEYNHKILKSPAFTQDKNVPLCLSTFNSNGPFISPMTDRELQRMRSTELHGNNWRILENVLKDQVSLKGIIGHIPNVAAGITLVELIREIGLKGEVYYKTVKGKTYVIIKGYPGQRTLLKGTFYLNTHPQIMRLGLSKVTVANGLKSGFKVSFLVYGVIKEAEALEMILVEGGLKPKFFTEMPAEVSMVAINTLIAAAASGAVALAGLPVATGIGVVLAVSITAGILLDLLDQKTGFTQKLSDATETLWKNMKKWWNVSPQIEKKSNPRDLLEGIIFRGGFVYKHNQLIQTSGSVVYTA